jgi:hypothetical protein
VHRLIGGSGQSRNTGPAGPELPAIWREKRFKMEQITSTLSTPISARACGHTARLNGPRLQESENAIWGVRPALPQAFGDGRKRVPVTATWLAVSATGGVQ